MLFSDVVVLLLASTTTLARVLLLVVVAGLNLLHHVLITKYFLNLKGFELLAVTVTATAIASGFQ